MAQARADSPVVVFGVESPMARGASVHGSLASFENTFSVVSVLSYREADETQVFCVRLS